MSSQISIYGHYGSHNHGNEAIVRGTKELLQNEEFVLYSYYPDSDKQYHLNELVEIYPFVSSYNKYSLKRIIRGIMNRLLPDKRYVYKIMLKPFFHSLDSRKIYLFEGGDQYCENDYVKNFYYFVNEKINYAGSKTVMLPATINVDDLRNKEMINDLNRYSIIFARESITYKGLLEAGISTKVCFAPDTAFIMKPKECDLPKLFNKRKVVGITIGLLAQGKEEYSSYVYKCTRDLISYIFSNTDFGVALIPHVNVGEKLTDITPLEKLSKEFSYSDRIVFIPEQRADEQKYIIGKCKFFVTLRTHVSIAAYSQAIPTVVIGYSQKSKGIAKDLFGNSDNYVINVEELKDNNRLIDSFKWLLENEEMIKGKFEDNLESYINKTYSIIDEVKKLTENIYE